jgi:hypothetical protein
VNAAICRWTLELANRRVYTLNDCKLAINGDDAVFPVNDEGRKIWERIGSFCGLFPSVGKVYFSNTYLNINSTSYAFHAGGYESQRFHTNNGDKWRLCHYELERYVNLGLLYGLKRSGGVASVTGSEGEWSFSQRVTTLIKDCPDELRERVLGQFLHLNKTQLTRVNLPWFIPESLGGLGLPECGKYKASVKDRILARMIYDDSKSYPIKKIPVERNWLTWDYAIKRFGSVIPRNALVGASNAAAKRQSVLDHETMMSWNQLLGLACVEGLFRCDKSILYKASSPDEPRQKLKKERECMAILRGNSRSYKKALLATGGNLRGLPRFDPNRQYRTFEQELRAAWSLATKNGKTFDPSQFEYDTSSIPYPVSVDPNDLPALIVADTRFTQPYVDAEVKIKVKTLFEPVCASVVKLEETTWHSMSLAN